jgi:hypothetical protein
MPRTAVDARLEDFCERVTAAARRLRNRNDLAYTGPDREGFWHFHCPLPGPEDDPHKANGTPQAWVKITGGAILGGCAKCGNGKADADYLERVKAVIGWDDLDNVQEGKFGEATYRHHEYTTSDDKWAVRHTKVIFKDRRKAPIWQWSVMDRRAGAFGSYRIFKPSEFCAEHYPELKHFTLALKVYGVERFVRSTYRVVVLEGERDVDTFNDLMAAADEADLIATCLPHQTPSALSAHQRAIFEGRDVILIGDADEGGKRFVSAWHQVLSDGVASVRIFPPEMLELTSGKDFTDHVEQQETAGRTRVAIVQRLLDKISRLPISEPPISRDWRSQLLCAKTGGVKSDSIGNAELVLTMHPEVAGRIRCDIRLGEAMITEAPWGADVRGARPLANKISAWLEVAEKLSISAKALEAALNFESVAPAWNPFEELSTATCDLAALDDFFIKRLPLAVPRHVAVRVARLFWADFAAKLRGELVPQRMLLGIATPTLIDVARMIAGPRGRVHTGTVRANHMAAFAQDGVVLVQIGLDAAFNRRTAPDNLANIFAAHFFNVATQRRCPTPMFIAVGAIPTRADTIDKRVTTLQLENPPC